MEIAKHARLYRIIFNYHVFILQIRGLSLSCKKIQIRVQMYTINNRYQHNTNNKLTHQLLN